MTAAYEVYIYLRENKKRKKKKKKATEEARTEGQKVKLSLAGGGSS